MSLFTVRAKVRPDAVSQVEAAVATMFTALEEAAPPNVRYTSCRLADGVTYLTCCMSTTGPTTRSRRCPRSSSSRPGSATGWTVLPRTPRPRSSAPTACSEPQGPCLRRPRTAPAAADSAVGRPSLRPPARAAASPAWVRARRRHGKRELTVDQIAQAAPGPRRLRHQSRSRLAQPALLKVGSVCTPSPP